MRSCSRVTDWFRWIHADLSWCTFLKIVSISRSMEPEQTPARCWPRNWQPLCTGAEPTHCSSLGLKNGHLGASDSVARAKSPSQAEIPASSGQDLSWQQLQAATSQCFCPGHQRQHQKRFWRPRAEPTLRHGEPLRSHLQSRSFVMAPTSLRLLGTCSIARWNLCEDRR